MMRVWDGLIGRLEGKVRRTRPCRWSMKGAASPHSSYAAVAAVPYAVDEQSGRQDASARLSPQQAISYEPVATSWPA